MRVYVCVRERERVRVCVHMCVYVCVCVCVCERGRESVCVFEGECKLSVGGNLSTSMRVVDCLFLLAHKGAYS